MSAGNGSDDTEVFLALKPKLFGVAYRMLGSVADAEDVVQEAFLRWRDVDSSEVRSAEAFLTTVVVRLSGTRGYSDRLPYSR